PKAEIWAAIARRKPARTCECPGSARRQSGAQPRRGFSVVRDAFVPAIKRGTPFRIPIVLKSGGDAPCRCQFEIATHAAVNSVRDEANSKIVASNHIERALPLAGIGRRAFGVDHLHAKGVARC